ncbi:MAG: DUF4129 domain-containing protein [Planctomycetaceae bacterium]|nr:DUF4129 domain-containing protein [Planctomycetaceae bacterium]
MFDPALLPDVETIRRTAQTVIERPIYNLAPLPESDTTFLSLILRLVRILLTPLRMLMDLLHGLPMPLQWAIIIALMAIMVALIIHIVYSILRAIRKPKATDRVLFDDPRQPRDPADLERQSAEAHSRHDYIAAIRLLFRASLLRLEQAEKREYRAGTTNREFLRRHRDTAVFEPIRLFVDTIENKWYGQGVCGPDDYSACRDAYANIVRRAKDGTHAHSA